MLMLIFTATLVKIAFALFRLYFSNIDPFFATKTALWLAENIILHYLLMFIFWRYGFKAIAFLYSGFLKIVNEFFSWTVKSYVAG